MIGEDEMEEKLAMRHVPALMTGASAEEVRERFLADMRAIRPESDGWQHDVRVVAHTVIATLAETDEPGHFNVSLQIKGNYDGRRRGATGHTQIEGESGDQPAGNL